MRDTRAHSAMAEEVEEQLDSTARQEESSAEMAQTSPSSFGQASRRRKKKAGSKWDGRVSSLTIEEYRAMKWGIDAGYRGTLRGGPRYSFRPGLSKPLRTNSDGMLDTNVCKAFDACHNTGPKFTMAKHLIGNQIRESPGAAYNIPSIMNPDQHPVMHKTTGFKFGSDTLKVFDEDAPAPGQYDQMQFKNSGMYPRKASYTMQGREAWNDRTAAPGPAPGEYKYENANRVGKITPIKWNMQGKTEPLEHPRGERRLVKPGPGHYTTPGTLGGSSMYVDKDKPSEFTFSRETRGLV